MAVRFPDQTALALAGADVVLERRRIPRLLREATQRREGVPIGPVRGEVVPLFGIGADIEHHIRCSSAGHELEGSVTDHEHR